MGEITGTSFNTDDINRWVTILETLSRNMKQHIQQEANYYVFNFPFFGKELPNTCVTLASNLVQLQDQLDDGKKWKSATRGKDIVAFLDNAERSSKALVAEEPIPSHDEQDDLIKDVKYNIMDAFDTIRDIQEFLSPEEPEDFPLN